jgi:peptidoglycan/xylan/chitin deacetylase (PgdA/CDA1 family)
MDRGVLAFVVAAGLAVGATAGAGMALAAECPGNPDALGISRTIVVEPLEHTRIGSMSYDETLPLADHEVVLTFDDGPLPPYTDRVLEILAHECVKATYFIVGSMARAYPDRVRKVAEAGHTIGTHSMTHPIPFGRLSFERTKAQIDDGIKATQAALGDESHLAPFFRFPGFARTEAAEDYLAEQGLMTWGADFPADDWMRIGPREIEKRAMRRIEAVGKGVLLLHDIHQRTVEALPGILKALKEGGYRIVHVVPATANLPKTVTADADWRVRDAPRRPLPMLALADVQDMSGLFVVDKTADELCALQARRVHVAKHRVREHHQRFAGSRRFSEGRRYSESRHRYRHRLSVRSREAASAITDGETRPKTRATKVAGAGGLSGLLNVSESGSGSAAATLYARTRHASTARITSRKEKKLAGAKTNAQDVHSLR